MNDLVFSTYVFGNYTRYIPYYIYAIVNSYPEYYVKIFVDHNLNYNEKRAVSLINSNNFEIKENYMNNLKFKDNHIIGGNKKINRWIIPYEEFKDFRYAYIGDVDMLIKKETPTLLDYHINRIKTTKLPFDNAIRNNTTRLTGLHFIEIKKYYSLIDPEKYLYDQNKLDSILDKCERNEHFLYEIVNENINLDKYKNILTYRPNHGLHLGLFRDVKNKEQMWKDKYHFFKHFIDDLPNYMIDPILDEMLKISPLYELIFVKEKLNECF